MVRDLVLAAIRKLIGDAASGKFNVVILVVCTGYLGNIEKGFQSIPQMKDSIQSMSVSISDLNTKMVSVVDRNEGLHQVLASHTRILQAFERRLRRIENNQKESEK